MLATSFAGMVHWPSSLAFAKSGGCGAWARAAAVANIAIEATKSLHRNPAFLFTLFIRTLRISASRRGIVNESYCSLIRLPRYILNSDKLAHTSRLSVRRAARPSEIRRDVLDRLNLEPLITLGMLAWMVAASQ